MTDKVAPFEAVRVLEGSLEVRIFGSWYKLVSIQDMDADALIGEARRTYGPLWLKRLSEDLPRVFRDMGSELAARPQVKVATSSGAVETLTPESTAANRKSALEFNRANAWAMKPAATEADAIFALLESRFSYWRLLDDPETVLDPIREFIRSDRRGGYELGVAQGLMRCGDAHTRTVRGLRSLLVDASAQHGRRPAYLPVVLSAVDSECFGVNGAVEPLPAGTLAAIDGVPISTCIDAVRQWVGPLSPQLQGGVLAERLIEVHYLRLVLGLAEQDTAVVAIEQLDGRISEHSLRTQVVPVDRSEGGVESRVVDGNVGLLRIGSSRAKETDIVAGLESLRSVDALVVDLRGNRGGTRAGIAPLVSRLMHRSHEPVVFNVAAKRLAIGEDRDDPSLLADRGLFPADDAHFTKAERASIASLQREFVTEFDLPPTEFSSLRFGVVSPDPESWTFGGPVAVLTDEFCISAAEILASALIHAALAIHVGIPTGGGSGRPVVFGMRSGVFLQVSSMASFQPTGLLYEKRGLSPEITVRRSPLEVAGDVDETLQVAIRALGSPR